VYRFPDAERDPNGHAKKMHDLYTLIWRDQEGDVPIGYLPQAVLDALQTCPESIRGALEFDPAARTIRLFQELTTEPERTQLIAGLTAYWRANQTFGILKGWRDELWPVYGRDGQLLFKMERSAVGLFGMTRYGVHMIAYVRCNDGKSNYPYRIWVPKRSNTKSTYAGMLDNTVAGGLAADETVEEALVREADEEGSLPEALVQQRAKEVGTVSYVYITDPRSGGESNLIYPECQWIYDLELPEDGSVVPARTARSRASVCAPWRRFRSSLRRDGGSQTVLWSRSISSFGTACIRPTTSPITTRSAGA